MNETNKERANALRAQASSIRLDARFVDRGYRDEMFRARALEIEADMLDPPPSLKSIPVQDQRVRPASLDRALLLIEQQFGKKPVESQKEAP